MRLQFIIVAGFVFSLTECRQYIEREITNYEYFDVLKSDTISSPLFAVTDEKFLQYGARVAYIDHLGDTIIPFGKFGYYGTDTLMYYANVMEHPNDTTFGRRLGINRDQMILFDLVMFDNGPEPFNEELTRVLRNGKMGYANKFGQIQIPCAYAYARWFKDGKAEVTFQAKEYMDLDEHRQVESDEWFTIDKSGEKIK